MLIYIIHSCQFLTLRAKNIKDSSGNYTKVTLNFEAIIKLLKMTQVGAISKNQKQEITGKKR